MTMELNHEEKTVQNTEATRAPTRFHEFLADLTEEEKRELVRDLAEFDWE